MTVVALYIDPKGPYPVLLGSENCWDEQRDAKLYDGPHPVVAHPPCGGWGKMRYMRVPNRDRRADELSCGPAAVKQVRAFGGVLEQPADSKLWEYCELPSPKSESIDAFGGFCFEVTQVSWGHVARKKTWLYFVGIDREVACAGIRTGGTPTHWVSGGRNPLRKNGCRGGGVVPPGIKVCSAQQRRRTPTLFAEWLVELARSVKRSADAV